MYIFIYIYIYTCIYARLTHWMGGTQVDRRGGEAAIVRHHPRLSDAGASAHFDWRCSRFVLHLCIPVYLVIYDSG